MLNLNFNPFPNLITERLLLRQLHINDANEIRRLRSDAKVNKFIDRPNSVSLEEAKTFIENINERIAANQSIYWAITLKPDSALIGTICYWNICAEKNMAETGYELRPEYQGKGIMHEAISRVVSFGFDDIKFKVITAWPKEDNTPSIKLLLKNNFLLDTDYKFVNKQERRVLKFTT